MELIRMFLVLGHLAALMAAAIAVAFGDFALLGRRQIQGDLLHSASKAVAIALGALWLTGLGIIYVDTHFALAAMLAKPKLLAKLTVVLLLTLNGVFMHAKVLPALQRVYARAQGLVVAQRATRVGAISAAGWVFGVFLGVAKPLAPILGYAGFMALFAAVVLGALAVSSQVVLPELRRRLTQGHWGDAREASSTPPAPVMHDADDADQVAAA
jgi:hypothetical protein